MNSNDKQFQELHKALIALKDDIVTAVHQKQPSCEVPLPEKKVLEMLDISPKTIRAYRNDGILGYSQIGKKYFYKMSDIERMLTKAYVEAYNLD